MRSAAARRIASLPLRQQRASFSAAAAAAPVSTVPATPADVEWMMARFKEFSKQALEGILKTIPQKKPFPATDDRQIQFNDAQIAQMMQAAQVALDRLNPKAAAAPPKAAAAAPKAAAATPSAGERYLQQLLETSLQMTYPLAHFYEKCGILVLHVIDHTKLFRCLILLSFPWFARKAIASADKFWHIDCWCSEVHIHELLGHNRVFETVQNTMTFPLPPCTDGEFAQDLRKCLRKLPPSLIMLSDHM